jgi:hypothetical protein
VAGLLVRIACIIGVVSVIAAGCAYSRFHTIEGGLDDAFVEQLRVEARRGTPVALSSYGGNPAIAFAAAPLIDNYPGEIGIGRMCLSSCAEFALPTKAHKILVDEPLIGFHGSDQIARWLASKTGQPEPYCDNARAEYQSDRFRALGWNPDFWKEVATRLMIISTRNKAPPGQCASMANRYELVMWFPTSRQMGDLLGFVPSKPLCADDEKCWRLRIRELMYPDNRFMIGDSIFYLTEDEKIEPISRDLFKGPYLVP